MAKEKTDKERIETISEALLEHIASIDEKINGAIMSIVDNIDEIVQEKVRKELERIENERN